ncbi:hypothetical protein L218DRAFT_1055665 [Marasmius fiardii PR-910]|nr:hypothetical protein L218DRAFT_1055665 [Marasmius fiardii PR-910]
MSSPYRPDEDEATINIERFFVAGLTINGVGYGLQIFLYYTCANFLWSRQKLGRQPLFLLGYISFLLTVETIYIVVQGNTLQIMYVDNRNYAGGPWQYFLATQNLADNVIYYTTLFLMTFFSDLLVLWRCWVIWRAISGIVKAACAIVIPGIILVASFVMGVLWILQSTHPGLSMYSALPLAFGTSYYAISLGVNIMVTILITIRLLLYRKRSQGSLSDDHASSYLSLATIFIESAALYSVCSFVFLITYAVNTPANQIMFAVASSAQQIAGYLIIYRVANGRAWTHDTVKQTMTIPAFNKNSALTTELSTKPGVAFKAPAQTTVHATSIISQLRTIEISEENAYTTRNGAQYVERLGKEGSGEI